MKSKISEEILNAESIINDWFKKLVHETVIQREADLYNKFHAAKEELISLFAPKQPVAKVTVEQPIEEIK